MENEIVHPVNNDTQIIVSNDQAMEICEEPASAVIAIVPDTDAVMEYEQPAPSKNTVTSENWYRRHREIRKKAGLPIQEEDTEQVDNQEEIDDFADRSYTGWRAAAKDILYLLFYDPDAGDFTYTLNEETLGEEIWYDYKQSIKHPISF